MTDNKTDCSYIPPTPPTLPFLDPALSGINRKLIDGKRLDRQDGLACLATSDLAGLGALAHGVRTARHGLKATYVSNQHLNYTNICANKCRFCAFHRDADQEGAYLITPEQAAERISQTPVEDLREIHIVGGCHPDLGFDYYLELMNALQAVRPGIGLKAFTAVEIRHLADKAGLTTEETLVRLKEAGLTGMPGGGAEVFSERIRAQLFPGKISADEWLAIHGQAHALGIGTNATLLFGHIETAEEIVDHLIRLRDQQDKSGGFRAFIPLAFHPENTPLSHLPGPSGVEILKVIALSRLLLDNIAHIKAYWVMLGMKLTQTALSFGANDLEGTIVAERIAHDAGAKTAKGMTRRQLVRAIEEAGFIPTERDTRHDSLFGD